MAAGSSGDRSLEATPTWAVALVCAVMVIISVIIEHAIHKLGKWFQRRHKKAMNEALEKIKAELMLLGFISLLLTIGQTPISKICIPAKAGDIMLPCKKTHDVEKEDRDSRRRLLWHQEKVVWHRILAGSTVDYCSKYEILLIVGMKLEIVIMEMAHKIQDRTSVVKGAPIIEPSNKFFWFNRPQWILFLIHLTLFENAFQMAHFLWSAYSFGLKSCFHENLAFTVAKVIMGLALQFLCSYITFPLYALVTQMGSHMKKAIFEEQTAKALIRWRRAAKERKKLRGANSDAGYMSGENTPSRGSSPIHLLHKYKSNSVDVESVPSSPRFYHSDNENSVIEAPPFVNHGYSEPRRPITMGRNPDVGNSDFSFGAPQ
ncbi:putative MLO protein [Cocos nucifera]|nr:putative MLO protein [Cocos nucifera]